MRPLRTLAPFALAAAAVMAAALSTPAQAGIVINAKGIFLTDPAPFQSPRAGVTGFRQFGRAGTFASPGPETPRLAGRSLGFAGQKAPPAALRDAAKPRPLVLFD